MKAELNGVDRVLSKLKIEEKKHPNEITVVVGYTAHYALNVHERVEMKWKGLPRSGEVRFGGMSGGSRWVKTGYDQGEGKGFYWDPQGQATAKFLETPAREKRGEIVKMIREVTKITGDLEQGLIFAGLFLQRESQQRVPVDEGNLKASAFTSVVRHGGEVVVSGQPGAV